MISADIPTTIDPEASALAVRLGLQSELSEMVDHVKRNVPGLISVTVEFAPAYDTGEDGILILGVRDAVDPSKHDYWEQFSAWKIARYSADVWRHVNLILLSKNANGG
ncbi:MAG: hypothetical protein L0Y72_10280 [Gemmataceae bacterium]|nr:hypothetical protein [Gemmataceae bacterium]MCI0739420.1 hypothetical protein [Gemmataceae bacterium]